MSVFNYLDYYWSGLWITFSASILSFVAAMVIGTIAATARNSPFLPIRFITAVYVEFTRNTPALVQIFFIYFGLPMLGIRMSAYVAGIVALSFNAGAYLCEIIRTGIASVPPGQLEAARTLGLNKRDTFLSVVLPQAIRTVYPPVVNEFLQLVLSTSLLSTIALNELTGAAMIVNSLTFETIASFGLALVMYLILTNVISYGSDLFARKVFKPALPDMRKVRKLPRRRDSFVFARQVK